MQFHLLIDSPGVQRGHELATHLFDLEMKCFLREMNYFFLMDFIKNVFPTLNYICDAHFTLKTS